LPWYFLFEILYAFLFCSVPGCMPTLSHCPWSDEFKYILGHCMCMEVCCSHHCALWPILIDWICNLSLSLTHTHTHARTHHAPRTHAHAHAHRDMYVCVYTVGYATMNEC
jgi:hypothetical protein